MGRENWEPQETSRVEVIPDAVVLTSAVSGPLPAPGLNQAVHDVWPRDVSPAAVVFFQRCIQNVHLSGKGPKAGVWTEAGEGQPPGEIVLSSRPAPSWARGRPGTQPPGQAGKSQGRVLPSESKRCPGQRPGAVGQEPQKTNGAG